MPWDLGRSGGRPQEEPGGSRHTQPLVLRTPRHRQDEHHPSRRQGPFRGHVQVKYLDFNY